MKIRELREAIQNENDEDEVIVGLDMEDKLIVASLSVYRVRDDDVVDIMTSEYSISGFATERNGDTK